MRRYPGNHTDSELLSVPRFLKTRPGAPQTHLAYITDSEANLLQENKPGTPHGGPHGIPNYDAYSWDPNSGRVLESSSGTQQSARENPQDRSQQRQQTSYSTRDVRSAAGQRDDPSKGTREAFRQRTGSTVETPAERIARTRSYLTGKDKFINMPIWNPAGLSYEEQLKIANKGDELKAWEIANRGKGAGGEDLWSKDWDDFLDPLKGRHDISDPGFGGTSKGWYWEGPKDERGNIIQYGEPGGPGSWAAGYSNAGGGRNDYGGGSIGPAGGPIPRGVAPDRWGQQAPWLQAMISTHGGPGFKQGFARGGIVSLVT